MWLWWDCHQTLSNHYVLQGIRVIRVAASTDGGKWLVDTPLLKPIHPFDHRRLCLALRPDIIEHRAMDLSGPVQYIDQTCYLLPSNLIPRVILHLLHKDSSFLLEQAFRKWSILDSSSPNFSWRTVHWCWEEQKRWFHVCAGWVRKQLTKGELEKVHKHQSFQQLVTTLMWHNVQKNLTTTV